MEASQAVATGTDRDATAAALDDGVDTATPDVISELASGDRKADDVTAADELGALGFILAAGAVPKYNIPVDYLTDDEVRPLKPLVFVVEPQDGLVIAKLEARHIKDGVIDDIGSNASLVAEATIVIIDGLTGKQVSPTDPTWRGPFPEKGEAMARRFARQSGLLMGVASEIRRLSGYDPRRVHKSYRRGVDEAIIAAVGNS